jgi:hypothetical protein
MENINHSSTINLDHAHTINLDHTHTINLDHTHTINLMENLNHSSYNKFYSSYNKS